MSVQQATQIIVPITSPHFAKGYRLGRIWFFHGEAELPVDDQYLITNITHYCESRFHTDPAWLAERIGFIMGMVSGNCIPEE